MIQSILDTDLYKLTIQQAVMETYPGSQVSYQFINRNPNVKFSHQFLNRFADELETMSELALTNEEYNWLKITCPYFKPWYLDYLRGYRFNPREITFDLMNNDLRLKINGPWYTTVLWEVPLMAMISEIYFETCDTNWTMNGQEELIKEKMLKFQDPRFMGLSLFSDFGTRRRRNFETQSLVVNECIKHKNCIGTSNVYLAYKYGVKPIGTVAHEWTMGTSAIRGLSRANFEAIRAWADVYGGQLGIALTDTFGTDAFLKDFDAYYARLYDGVRQDSGKPEEWLVKMVNHYNNLGINPRHKKYIFSDGLDCDRANDLARFAYESFNLDKQNIIFGIGTHLTNDFINSPALNMVIKLFTVDGIPVVKLSDVFSKASGDPEMIEIAKKIFLKDKND
jgi:nicotinate phosphoribosyltransferase